MTNRLLTVLESNSICVLNATSPRSITFPLNRPGHFGTSYLSCRYNLDVFDSSLTDHRGLILSMMSKTVPPICSQIFAFDRRKAIA